MNLTGFFGVASGTGAICVFIALITTGPAAAWQAITKDDGILYYGAARFGEGIDTVEVFCAGRSPADRPVPPDYPSEYQESQAGALDLVVGGSLIGAPAPGVDQATRADVTFVIGGQGYKIPAFKWDLLFSNWVFPLAPDGAFLAAMASGQDVLMQLDGGQAWLLAGPTAPAAFGQMQSFCRPYLDGTAVAPAPATPAAEGGMEQAAKARIFEGCGGQAEAQPGYLLTGDLDRDGIADAVVDWGAISCMGDLARPFCGASMCSADVFLSRVHRPGAQPDPLLAQGVRIEPSPAGGAQLVLGGSLSMCQGATSCQFVWRWNGQELAPLR